MAGPLHGLRVLELAGLGPAPFCAMLLADLGAEVICVDRPGSAPGEATPYVSDDRNPWDVLGRSRRRLAVDLKHPQGQELVSRMCAGLDVLVEGFRPGVAERLGLGPDSLCGSNPHLVYARVTGWGRGGPLADRAGHDLNYLALAGVQAHVGRVGAPPTPPLSLVGDFGGGGMFLALGVCAALWERTRSGRGQVVDAAMVHGAALLAAPFFGAFASGFWSEDRGTNLLDSGAPFYDCYRCADGGWLSVAAIEPKFYAELLAGLGLADVDLPGQLDRAGWPQLREAFARVIATRTRDAWAEHFSTMDACVAPVLTMGEAPQHPQNRESGSFIDCEGVAQPAPGPEFSRSAVDPPGVTRPAGTDTESVLGDFGVDSDELARLRRDGVVA